MNRTVLSIAIILSFILNGCSLSSGASKVETLNGWHFQHNQGSNDFSVFFGLADKNDSLISADVDVDIRIENENGDEVYSATKSVTKDDFGTYTNKIAGERYLAEIRIPENEIEKGNSSNGTVYLTVYKDDILYFDEVNCDALYCLPILETELTWEPLPVNIDVKSYDGSIESTIQIDGVSYVYESDFTPSLKVTVTGSKIYERKSGSMFDAVSYKLCDEEGYVVDSGNLLLNSLSQGDKFKDDSITFYDVEPGKVYTISFYEYE